MTGVLYESTISRVNEMERKGRKGEREEREERERARELMPNKKKIYSLATLVSQLKLSMTGLTRKNGVHDVPNLD